MASVSNPPSTGAASTGARVIFQIIGLVCLAGFLVDMTVRVLPPSIGNVAWRAGILQQLSDRSIVFLIGVGFMLFSLESRRWMRRLSVVSLIVGVLFILSSLLVIRDSLTLQQQALVNINNQVSQVQTQIQNAQEKPNPDLKITPEQLEQAAKTINSQAEAAKENTKTTVLKTGIAAVGNLVVVGLGLISLGRYGMRSRRTRNYSNLQVSEAQL